MKRLSIAICLMLISVVVKGQKVCMPPTYLFNSLSNVSGSGGLGSIYRFTNALTGINTFVTITKLQNATITNSNMDVVGSYALAWQPTINFPNKANAGDSSYVEFTFMFVDVGTGVNLNSINNSLMDQNCMAMTIIDCDGPGNSNSYREMVKVSQTATLKGITNSTINVYQDKNWISMISGPTQFNNIDTINYGAMAQINFPDKTQKFKVRIGTVGAVPANLNREFSFYFKSFTGLNVPLPINLVNFKSNLVNKTDALLGWATVTEHDADRFDVYRSFDGVSYEFAGSVNAAGNSYEMKNYEFTDNYINNSGQKMVFYKLKMVQNDGKFEWSGASKLSLAATVSGAGALAVSPNPTTTILNLDLYEISASEAQVEILDIYGKTIMTSGQPEIINDNLVRLDISHLSNGMYFVRLINNSGSETTAVKFVKQ